MRGELTQRQKEAAALLSQGLNAARTAEAIGCDRVTIGMWKKRPDFQEYLQKLIAERESDRKTAATERAVKEVFDRQASINEWKVAKVEANKRRLRRGEEILEKMMGRFRDLPQEAYPPTAIAHLLKVGEEMVEGGFSAWGESIDLEQAKPSHTAEIESIQRLVDAGILPQSAKEEISGHLDEFQRKAIASLSQKVAKAENSPQPEQ